MRASSFVLRTSLIGATAFGCVLACGGSDESGGTGGASTGGSSAGGTGGATGGTGGGTTGGTGGATGGAGGATGGTGGATGGAGGASGSGGATGGAAGSGGSTGGAAGADGSAGSDSGSDGSAGSDAGADATSDATADSATDAPAEAATCTIGSATSSATANDLSLFGTPVYFDNGASLPAGTYIVSYEDGCFKYGGGQGWTVNAYAQGGCCHWWMIGDTTADKKFALPGTIGYAVGSGAYANFQDCVNASKQSAPVQFNHPGGKLGIWLQDSPYTDNTAGENGKNPKWKLEKVGVCVDGGIGDASGG